MNSSTKHKEITSLLDWNAPNSKLKFPINPMTFADISSLYSSDLEFRTVPKYPQFTMMPRIAIVMHPLRRSMQQQQFFNMMLDLIMLFLDNFCKIKTCTSKFNEKLRDALLFYHSKTLVLRYKVPHIQSKVILNL